MNRPAKTNKASKKHEIKSLQPLKNTQYEFRQANIFYVWFTLFIIWLTSLLPWRNWPMMPDLLLVLLAFWCAHRGQGVGFVAAFLFGFVADIHAGLPAGVTSVTYLLTVYAVVKMRKRMMSFDVFGQMVYMLPVFVLAQIPSLLVESWLAGRWMGWLWIVRGILATVVWFVAHLIIKLPWHAQADDEAVV